MSQRVTSAPPFARQAAEVLADAFADYNARFADGGDSRHAGGDHAR
jgi:hypothetical protein